MKQGFKQAQQQQQQQGTCISEQDKIRAQQAAMQEDSRAMAPGTFNEDGFLRLHKRQKLFNFLNFLKPHKQFPS